MRERMPPPKSVPEVYTTRLPKGTIDRIKAVLRPKESQSDFGREQIIEALLERERTKGTRKP